MKKVKNIDQESDIEIVTEEIILKSLTREFQSVNNIIFSIKEVKDNMDYYYVNLKLMLLERQGLIEVKIEDGEKLYRLK